MTTALQKVQPLPVANMGDLATIGQMLAQTGMFGTNNPAEGFVIAAMCHQAGITYMEYMQTYHLIKGKVSKRADAIQADFQRSGGKIKINQRDANGVVVELEKNGTKYTSALMWSDCLNEPFVYEGREGDVVAALNSGDSKTKATLKIKTKYATPRSRMQMLWARAISDGVRAVDPGSVQGAYTPEEIEDFAAQALAINPAEAAKRAEVIVPQPQPQPLASTPVAEPEDTPFDMVQKDPDGTGGGDCTTCPIDGPMQGQKWADMTIEHLRLALNLANPELTAGHRKAIQDAINNKQEQEG